ncbi:RagB/SusD family nutrient uptake outer membrane protein [Flavobacterium macrobrachii]|uniref:RagB/SusD family nutrient uptake outer membrane protein n=1 Tax=Flavobacterium macrobrachii TaxID=591204 RepID=A0ABS2CZD4_9FLAO|nr:RagB/SusD family nutrient uptake outer membrane protein [Flavobacterium macrobrachii]MBM6500259.1 RagB/SusD family nutrient uptake outer membrane protein [Flavobacterium macrobrachii]
MKKSKFNFVYVIITAFVFVSCESDLDITPENPQVFLSDEFFATENAYKKGLAGVYGNLALTGTDGPSSSNIGGVDAGTSQYGRCLWYLQNLATDEAIWSYENDEGVRDLQRNIWTSDNAIIRGMYSRAMFHVALTNEYLRQTTSSKLSSRGVTDPTLLADIEDYRNEMKAMRALAYYHLMDMFGKAAFNTEEQPVAVAGVQYTRQQLFEFIETDLINLIPSLKAPRTNESGRLDQAFARMILAKMYLNAEVYIGQNRYQDCMNQCESIINGGYVLELNYLDNFKADNDTSTEMIFAIQSDGVVTQNFGPTTVMINGSVGSLEQNGISLGVGAGGWGGAIRLRKQFVEKFNGSEFDFDIRKTISGGGQRTLDILDINNRNQGYILSKYSNVSSSGINGSNSTFVDTDFPLFRLADVYLMYAEAQMRKDGATNGSSTANVSSTSLGYINALRERANDGNFANVSTSQVTLDFILDERSRELHWEAHRRQDLIRFGKYSGGIYNWAWKGNAPGGIAIPTFRNLYPIPQLSLVANPNLTQNTGY